MAVGDGAELFVTGTLGVRVDDNVFLSSVEENDVIFDINPGLELVFGRDAQTRGSLTLVESIARYSDNDHLNTELFSSEFTTRFDDGKTKLNFNAAFRELNQNTPDIRGLTRRDATNLAGNFEVGISQITAIGAGVIFHHENYKRVGYTDSDSLTVPLNVYYELTPKVDLSLGYRFRDYQVDIGQDSNDHFFNIGARGEFTPKFSGNFAVGWNTRDLELSGNRDMLGLDASFAYQATPKTSFQFAVSNDFGTTPQGQQQKNFSMNGAVRTELSPEFSVNAGLSYRGINYTTRTDDYIEGNIGFSYIINANARIVGAYVYRDYSSNIAASEFRNNVFSLAGNFRY